MFHSIGDHFSKYGAAEEQEVDGGDEGSSQGGEDEDGPPSWRLGGFESAEAEQRHVEQQDRWHERMWEKIAESQRVCKEQRARLKEMEREGKHWR